MPQLSPHVDDKVWVDKQGMAHEIAKMDTSYGEACIRFLNNKGYRNEIPKALFKRYNQRHDVIKNEFEELL